VSLCEAGAAPSPACQHKQNSHMKKQ
jgi:hypothetical protein